jgi:hypothetical protein
VPGSRQFKDFEDYLLPTAAFEALLRSDSLPLVIAGSFDRYWTERETLLLHELQKVDGLAARHAWNELYSRSNGFKALNSDSGCNWG